jgi:hypothetical protein
MTPIIGPRTASHPTSMICDRCLSWEPNDRPASAQELGAELRSYLSTHAPANFAWVRSAPRIRSRLSLIGALLIGMAALFEAGRRTGWHQAKRSPINDKPNLAPAGAIQPPKTSELTRRAVDLMPQVDPGRDSIGTARRKEPGGTLLSSPDPLTRIVILKGMIPPKGTGCTIVCTVRESGVLVTCNGKQVVDCPGGPARFEVPPAFVIPDRRALFLGSMNGIVAFERVELIPLGDAGSHSK